MKIQKRGWPVLIIAFSLMAAGCSLRTTSPGTETTAAETVTGTGTGLFETAASEETEEIQGDKGKDGAGRVAAGEETSSRINVADEDMEPVYAGEIKDGVYPVKVDSSSNMFQVTGCELTVRDGRMTAVMTMGGTGYLKLFMGTGEEAAKAGEEDFIPYRETEDGLHTFQVPVEALDMGIDCSAFSKKKEKWYDRVLVFRADSLPGRRHCRRENYDSGKPGAQRLYLYGGGDTGRRFGKGFCRVSGPAPGREWTGICHHHLGECKLRLYES